MRPFLFPGNRTASPAHHHRAEVLETTGSTWRVRRGALRDVRGRCVWVGAGGCSYDLHEAQPVSQHLPRKQLQQNSLQCFGCQQQQQNDELQSRCACFVTTTNTTTTTTSTTTTTWSRTALKKTRNDRFRVWFVFNSIHTWYIPSDVYRGFPSFSGNPHSTSGQSTGGGDVAATEPLNTLHRNNSHSSFPGAVSIYSSKLRPRPVSASSQVSNISSKGT